MRARIGSRPAALLLHLAAFEVAAWIAFRHNIDGLFYHYDGSYMLLDALSQRHSDHNLLELWSNFGQSIGSIQFTVNVRLFPFYWPLYWAKNLLTDKVGVYLLIAAAIFTVDFVMARLLSASFGAALLAGWILGVLGTPFIPQPAYYPILWVAPQTVLVAILPAIVFALLRPIGRSRVAIDALCGACLLGLVMYLLAASPGLAVLIAPGAVPYVAAALCLSMDRAELLRKLFALTAISAIAFALRWPWYLYGLFAYTAAHLYGQDFTSPYTSAQYVSLLFQGPAFGWPGPALVIAAAVGAALSWRSDNRELRAGARTVIGVIAGLLVLRVVFALSANWILPPPIYLEIAFWPLYATFAAAAIVRGANVTAVLLPRWRMARTDVRLIPVVLLAALALTRSGPPVVSPYHLPPTRPPIVDMLANQTAMRDGARFNGRVATILPVTPDSDAWMQQFVRASQLVQATGNDHLSLGLWWYRIPTLFEYNQFTSPAVHALRKLTLENSAAPQERNVTIYSRANPRILQLLGVRYLIMPPGSPGPIGVERQTETIAGETWGLSELAAPNLGTYAPTAVEYQGDIRAALERLATAGFDPTTTVVASDDIPGNLVPADEAALYFAGDGLRLVATSPGRTLIVVPREYSRCLELRVADSGNASLHRVDGLLTGVLFERRVDAVLRFRIGPLHHPLCRYEDYRDFDAVLTRHSAEAPRNASE